MEKITEKKFRYYLDVLPPLIMGKDEVICFLCEFDNNKKLVEGNKLSEFNDLFVQGEGWDNHQIYGCKDHKHFYIGETERIWNTEDFRYPDTGNNMLQKIQQKLSK